MVYSPEFGFFITTQTRSAANYSAYLTPFTNLNYDDMILWLQHIKNDLQEDTLIAVVYSPTSAKTIEKYIDYISLYKTEWAKNQFSWKW